jgi:O-antigen/teichoic acid export membrane protein
MSSAASEECEDGGFVLHGARASTIANLAKLSSANLISALLVLISAPLLARALGATGRGQLAAVFAPLALAPTILKLGLGDYLTRETARRRVATNRLLGLTGIIVLGVTTPVAIAGTYLAGALVGDGSVAGTWLTVGLGLMPITLTGSLFLDVLAGQQRWMARSLLVVGQAVATATILAALFATNRLTVASAAATNIGLGVLVVLAAGIYVRRELPLALDLSLRREALAFGVRVWVGRLANVANLRLDQVVLIPIVSSADLGRYVVAAALGSIPTLVAGPVGQILEPRVANRGVADLPRVLRCTILATGAIAAVVGAVTSPLLRHLFGPSFTDATGPAWLLLAASVPYVARFLVRSCLVAAGHPSAGSKAELVALAATTAGLVILTPAFGILGAAVTSLGAYTISAGLLLRSGSRILRVPVRDIVFPRFSDLAWVHGALRCSRRGH